MFFKILLKLSRFDKPGAILAISFVCIVTVLTSKFKNYFLWYCMMHEAEGVMSFMSREHLLLHTGEDTIHDPKIEKKNLSPKDKAEELLVLP